MAMKGFSYFENWLIEGKAGILVELEKEFRFYQGKLKELTMERGKRIRLELELEKLKPNNSNRFVGGVVSDFIGTGNAREGGEAGPSSSTNPRGGQVTFSNTSLTIPTPKRGLEPDINNGAGGPSSRKKPKPRNKSSFPGGAAVSPVTPTEIVSGHPLIASSAPAPVEGTGTGEVEPVIEGGGGGMASTSGGSNNGAVPTSLEGEAVIPDPAVVTPTIPVSNQLQQVNEVPPAPVADNATATATSVDVQATRPSPLGAPDVGNCLAPPPSLTNAGHHCEKLEQLWTLVMESCLPDFEPAIRIRSIKRVAEAVIPHPSQQELVRFICDKASAQGPDWNCSRSLYCLKLLASLLDNPTQRLEDQVVSIRETIAGLVSATVTKLQGQPNSRDWWELLDSGASLLGKMASMWNGLRGSLNHLFNLRLCEVFVLEISDGRGLPLMALYHTILTVLEMGEHEILTLLLPNLRHIGRRFQLAEQSIVRSEAPKLDQVAIERIRSKIVEVASPILLSTRALPDEDPLNWYEDDFGNYFGGLLFHRVQELRMQQEQGGE